MGVHESCSGSSPQVAVMSRKDMIQEIQSVLTELDNLANVWGDEGVFRRCRDRLRKIVETPCTHENETFHRYGQFMGTVVCNDCGRERDWGAY